MTAPATDPQDSSEEQQMTSAEAVEVQDTEVQDTVDAEQAPVETDQVAEQVEDEVAAPTSIAAALAEPIYMEHPITTVGRRKEAVVRIRLMPGTGKYSLNGKDLATYFPNKVHQQLINDPFTITERAEMFDVVARLHGGGTSGQAGALRLAIARALIEVQPDDRPVLKSAGFLTRDPRATERKKYGLKKARKAPQYSKR